MRMMFAICLTALLAVSASGQTIGEVTPAGLRFLGSGIWQHADGRTFTRHWVNEAGSWRNGCYVAGNAYWQYVNVPSPVVQQQSVTNITNITQANPNWRVEIAQGINAEIAYNFKQQKEALDRQEYLEGIQILAQVAARNRGGYGGGYPNGYNLQGSVTNYGASGSTQFGYSREDYKQLVQAVYGGGNEALLIQQAGFHVDQAGRYWNGAMTGFQGIAAKSSADKSALVAQFTKGQIAIGILKALDTPTVTQQGYQFSVSPNGVVQKDDTAVPNTVKNDLINKWGKSALSCLACHDRTTGVKKGNFAVQEFPSMSDADRQKVLARLTTSDPGKLMPRSGTADASTPGQALPQDQIQAWILCPTYKVED